MNRPASFNARIVIVPLILFFIGVGTSFWLSFSQYKLQVNRLREKASAELDTIRGDLNRELFAAIHLTQGVASLVKIEPTLSRQRFEEMAEDLISHNPLIRDIALAPDNVVRYVYPRESNESVIGLDYLRRIDQWDAVLRAISKKQMVLAGPVDLVQGGVGIISRTPIFVAGRYWGLFSTVIDFPTLINATGLEAVTSRLSIALRGKDGLGSTGDIFWGSPMVFSSNPVVLNVTLPSGSWQIAAVPIDGWPVFNPFASAYLLLGSLLDFILSLLLFQVLRISRARGIEVRERKRTEVDLRTANRALAVKDFAIASAISGIVLTDSAGTVTYANASFAEIWGYPSSDLVGMNARDLVTDKEKLSHVLSLLHTEGRWIGEIEAFKKSGNTFTVQVAAHAVKGSDGKTICLMASCVDISEQIQMREELQRTQKLESLSLFAAGVAHDFNNFLTGLFNGLELIKDYLPSQSPAHSQFDLAVSVLERARDLTRRLLVFAKGESPHRRKLMVAEIVRESCSLSLSGSRISYTVTVGENPWAVEADASQLSQVFNNIILNARQAMEDQGLLEISIENRVLAADGVGTLPSGDYVIISFRDTGPGIPDKTIERIFDPFFTTKEEGSGLGLATSYAIVKTHGGHIDASSRAGAGASFDVWLPALRSGEPEKGRVPSPEMMRGSGRVLVMDDDEVIRKLARLILAKAGYDVSTAGGGREAIEIYRSAVTERRPFDLVILDLTIRGGMGGEETLVELREINPHLAAIASTGYSGNSTFSQAKEIGFLGLLPKPYRPHELLSTVKAAITHRTPSTA